MRLAPLGIAAVLAAWAPDAWAQAGGPSRPSEAEIFGGGTVAPEEAGAGAATPPTGAPTTTPAEAAGGPAGETTAAPPAATDSGTARDQAVLGNTSSGEPAHLSDYRAPENPLQIGGLVYLRAQSSALQGDYPDRWSLSAPSLLDVYLDARPNPRVRAFVLGRMSYDPTAAPEGAANMPGGVMGMGGQEGAFAGGSPTGFTTFNAARGPNTLLDQLWIRFDIGQRVFVTAGKQHVRWGTGRFWQPTDYLHPVKRNPLDVFDARAGVSMLKLHFPWEERGWNFYAFAISEDPNEATNTLRRVAGGARAEIVIFGAELGLDVFARRDQKPRFGIDLSTGLGDFDVYADVGIRYGEDFRVVRRVDDPNAGVMCITPDGQPAEINNLSAQYQVTTLSGLKTQAVGGANYSRRYNDNDLFVIGAEYFYNQPGYSDPSLYPGLLFNSANTRMLNFFYTGRHYGALYLSLPAPYSWNRTTITASTLGNLSDQSFVSRLDYSHTLLTHISLEAFAGAHYGRREGEFRLGFDIPQQYIVDPVNGLPMCDPIPGFSRSPVLFNFGVALRMRI